MAAAADARSSLLQLFWELSSLEEGERLQGGKELLTQLQNLQDGCEEGVCSEVDYTIQRLVRGLASHRKGARQGYFTALTELLALFPEVHLRQVFELVHTHLQCSGSVKSQEERGAYFGRVFAFLALIQSGRLTETSDIVEVVKQLQVCSRKSYLSEFSAVAVSKLIERCPVAVVRDDIVPLLGLEEGWEKCSPERLFLVLHMNQHYGKRDWFKELLKTHWGTKQITSHTQYGNMATVLLESSSAHPRLHSVWPLVLSSVREKGNFGTFWKTVVDGRLLLSSHERRFLGFSLLESLLPTLRTSEVSLVFSPNLLRCLLNNLSSPSNYLHAAATHLLSEIVERIEVALDPSFSVAVLLHFQGRTGAKFDQLSGTKTIEHILAKLDANGLHLLMKKLQELFCDPTPITSDEHSDDTLSDTHSVQLWILDQILSLVRNRKLSRNDSWLLSAAQFLFLHSFFLIRKSNTTIPELSVPTTPVEKPVREACAQRFTSVLAELRTIAPKQEEGRKMVGEVGVMEGGQFFLVALVEFVRQLLSMEDHVTLVEPFTEEESEAWESVLTLVASLNEKEDMRAEEKGFQLLLSAVGLQLFSEREKASQVIQELRSCYEEMVASWTRTPKKRRKQEGEESGLGWIEVLTDVLLGYLSQPSQLWRGVVDQVFRMVAHCVTPAALQLVVKVLEPQAKEELMEQEEEGGDIGEAGGSEDESKEMEEDDGSGSGDENGALSSDDRESEEEGVDPVFRAEIRKALGAAAVDSEGEGSESDSSLDDEAMMAVDEALAAAFRSRLSTRKKQKKEDEKSIIHFKLRVLDLIETYIRKQSSNPLVLDLVVPLYRVIHTSHGKKDSTPLVDRVTSLYSKLCHLKGYPKKSLDSKHVHSQLHELLQFLYKANPQTAALITQGCMFMLRVLRGCDAPPSLSPLTTRSGRKRKRKEMIEVAVGILDVAMVTKWFSDVLHDFITKKLDVAMVTKWFSDVLHDFITKKNCTVHQVFFKTYIERYPDIAWHLVPRMVEDLPAAANHFRKMQVYEMIILLLSQQVNHKALGDHLPAISPSLHSHCVSELAAAHERPTKHVRPLLKLILMMVIRLRSHEELSSLLDSDALMNALQQFLDKPSLSVEVRAKCDKVVGAIQCEDVVAMTTRKRRQKSKGRMKRTHS